MGHAVYHFLVSSTNRLICNNYLNESSIHLDSLYQGVFMLTHVDGLHQRGNKLKAYAKVHTSFLLSTRQ